MNHQNVQWSDLPAEVVALIVAKMDEPTRRNYASTSTLGTLDVLLLPKSSLLSYGSRLALRLAAALPSYPRSQTHLAGMVEVWYGICLDVVQALQHGPTNEEASAWLQRDAVRHPPLVRRLDLRRAGLGTRSVPGGLTGLRVIDLSLCSSLAADWLPESSGGSVEVINASDSSLVCVYLAI